MLKTMGLILLAAGVMLGQQGEDKPYRVGNGVSAPTVLRKSDPIYTQAATEAKIEGTVLLSIVVGSDGVARDIQVVRSLDAGLDSAAIAAVQNWQFQPGTREGQAVSVKATIEVNFRLK